MNSWANLSSFYLEFFGDLFFIQEKKRQDKSQQINAGTWKQKVTHPHRGSHRGMDGFAMEIAIGKLKKAKIIFIKSFKTSKRQEAMENAANQPTGLHVLQE